MNTKDLISVIIPLYNETRFLKKALDSIFNQTYKKIEVIIVDSSVNQEVCEILSEYQNEYQDKIYVYKQEKNGVAAALNYGITKANGEFIPKTTKLFLIILKSTETIGQTEFQNAVQKPLPN